MRGSFVSTALPASYAEICGEVSSIVRAGNPGLRECREPGAAYRAFWKSAASNRPPGGESFVDQIARASAGLAALPAGEAILVVHSGTIRAVLAIALDLAPEQALRFVIDPLSLTRVDRLADGWRVVAVNLRWKD